MLLSLLLFHDSPLWFNADICQRALIRCTGTHIFADTMLSFDLAAEFYFLHIKPYYEKLKTLFMFL